MKSKLTPRIILLVGTFLIAVSAQAQTPEQNVNVTIRPQQTPEERVATEMKEKDLRKAAEEKRAEDEAARISETSPKNLLRRARIVFIQSDTEFFDSIQLQNELRKREEFDNWQMAIVDDWNKRGVVDVIVEVDRPLFTYTFTYKITDRKSGILLSSGKLTAFDGNVAAPKLAERIVHDIGVARGEVKPKK